MCQIPRPVRRAKTNRNFSIMAHATGRSDHSVALGHADRASRTRHRVWRCCHRRRPHRYGRWSMVDGRGSLLARLQTKTTLERPTHVLLAGLVNAHTHAAMSLLRDAPPPENQCPGMAPEIDLASGARESVSRNGSGDRSGLWSKGGSAPSSSAWAPSCISPSRSGPA